CTWLWRFQKLAVPENCETGNQAFSMRAGILTIRGSLLNHMLDKQRPRRIEIPEGWRTAAECRWRRKKGPKQRWSGYFSLCPFPSWKGVFSQNGPQRSRARRRCAAKRTLHGEDRSEILEKRERGGPKWTAKMAQSLTASDKGMRTSRIQAWYQNPKKHLILAQFSNSPWTGRLRRTLQNFTV